jgi:hypothetical protein
MARTAVKLNHSEIQSYLDGGHGVRELLHAKAAPVEAAAKADPHDASGAYEDSIHIEEDHTDRLVVRVVADVDYALVQEARYGVLARALDHAR